METGLGLSPPGEIIRSKYKFTFTYCDVMLERLPVFSKALFIGIPGFVISGNHCHEMVAVIWNEFSDYG